MGALKLRDPATGDWIVVPTVGPMGSGPQGDPGPPGPAGTTPRIAFTAEIASYIAGAVNTMAPALSGMIDIDPTRTYHVFAGHRCISDLGAVAGYAEMQVRINAIGHAPNDMVVTHDTGLWGAWSQQWIRLGSVYTATAASVPIDFRVSCSVAGRTFYTPRLTVLEY